jgi:hypothetical protein
MQTTKKDFKVKTMIRYFWILSSEEERKRIKYPKFPIWNYLQENSILIPYMDK